MSRDDLALTITPARIAFALSLLTFFGVFYTGTSMIIETRLRIAALEADQKERELERDKMDSKIDKLSDSLNEFNLLLREIQVRQREIQK